jgi:hypothetical protein
MREFVVYSKGLSFWNDGTAFEYSSPDEATLLSKVQIIENLGLVRDVTNKNVKRYRMTEELVQYLTETQSEAFHICVRPTSI